LIAVDSEDVALHETHDKKRASRSDVAPGLKHFASCSGLIPGVPIPAKATLKRSTASEVSRPTPSEFSIGKTGGVFTG
jgi:hypothetical protein